MLVYLMSDYDLARRKLHATIYKKVVSAQVSGIDAVKMASRLLIGLLIRLVNSNDGYFIKSSTLNSSFMYLTKPTEFLQFVLVNSRS
ncbi:hypothetical protein MUGA111182_11280 [Mucilaginibacter galii]|uniref:Uncharacterized protein n=1 Tax=Mucilaginibacter galii TaxID=2005073 RepID=A0A917J7M0_9SPHI|nr:hypothetical protein GCM10011425_18470 [Mucilaginibacter galii]